MTKKALGLTVGGVTLAAAAVAAFMSTNEEEAPVTPAPEPTFTQEEKLEMFRYVAGDASARVNEMSQMGVLPAGEIEFISETIDAISKNPPQELVEQIAEENKRLLGRSTGFFGFSPRSYDGMETVLEFLSPTLSDAVARVVFDNGCIVKYRNDQDSDDWTSEAKPSGVVGMACSSATNVDLLAYPQNAAGVAVSYDFDGDVAYYTREDSYYSRDNDDGFGVVTLPELSGSKDLADAFAAKAVAETTMREIQSQMLSDYEADSEQIHADLDQAMSRTAPQLAP